MAAVILGLYVFALDYYVGELNQKKMIEDISDYKDLVSKAQTVAFIALVYSENIRAYIARSFDRPFFINLLGNTSMQKAIVLAQICLYVAVLVPVLSDKILKLQGIAIGWEGWLLALIGPVATLILCELAKFITYLQNKSYQEKLTKKRLADEAKLESMTKASPVPAKVLLSQSSALESQTKPVGETRL